VRSGPSPLPRVIFCHPPPRELLAFPYSRRQPAGAPSTARGLPESVPCRSSSPSTAGMGKKEAREAASRPSTIGFTRPPPAPVQNGVRKGFVVLNLDGTPEDVRISWRATVGVQIVVFQFNARPISIWSRSQKKLHVAAIWTLLSYLHFGGKWLCAVIHGPSGYLDGYTTQSTGEGLRVKENMSDKKGSRGIYIERSELLPWDGGYMYAAKCRVGHLGLINSFSSIYKTVQGIGPELKDQTVISHGETLILHISEAGRSDILFSFIDSNFISGCLLGNDLLYSARHWRSKSEKPLRKMEEVYSPELADKSKGRMINQGAPRSEGRRIAKFADKKKGNMADEGAKLVDKKGRIADEEKEYGVELEEELSVLEDIRLLHKPNYTRELFCLDKMVVHLAAGRPVSNALEEYLRPRASDPDSEYLVTPFSKFNRSQEEKKKETNPDIEKTTSDMKRLRAKLSDNLHKSLNAVPNVNMAVNRAGIANLGNTCYASCTLQSLHSIGELKSALYSYPDDVQVNEDQKSHNLTIATRNMFHELDQNTGTVQPQHFLQTLRESSPQFKEKEGDGYRQQDAAECWTLLVNTISSTLTTQASDPASAPIKNIFKIDLLERHHCTANGEDKEYKNSVYDLKCSISDRVHHLNEGLKLLLKNSVRACWYPRRKANKNEK
uniref:ubiquitinyl hydrolase 1 n=1 Tax=Aegilops tauschii subsp. strangulata TaxID=200361 RepID=A0A453KTF2_AEGTS